MLSLASCGIANLPFDLDWLATTLNTLIHPDYVGDTKTQTREMLESARKKGLGAAKANLAKNMNVLVTTR